MPDLFLVFVIGLVSSVHCVGMCGGFVLALSQMHGTSGGMHGRQALYFAGKTLTYSIYGALTGAFGAVVFQASATFQNNISIGLGAVLVLIGLSLAGVLNRFHMAARLSQARPIADALGRLLMRPSYLATFGLGMLNGLLPCALVYGMLVKAASTGSPAQGALTMAVFGGATMPALFLLAATGSLLRPSWRMRLSHAGGVLVIVLGLLTMARGVSSAGAWFHAGHGGVLHVERHPSTMDTEHGSTHSPAHNHHHE